MDVSRVSLHRIYPHVNSLSTAFANGSLPSLKAARESYREVRAAVGLKPSTNGSWLTAPSDQAKFKKTAMPTYGLSLLPNNVAARTARQLGVDPVAFGLPDEFDACGNASPHCKTLCLNYAGHGSATSVVTGRLARTLLLFCRPLDAMSIWLHELSKASKRHVEFAHRPNVFSDIPWEMVYPDMLHAVDNMYSYDYTKHWNRRSVDQYHLTFSADERRSLSEIRRRVQSGYGNVAVVVDCGVNDPKPAWWNGMRTVDGDDPVWGDARYLDPDNRVVLLSAKGRARQSRHRHSPFIWPLTVSYPVEGDDA